MRQPLSDDRTTEYSDYNSQNKYSEVNPADAGSSVEETKNKIEELRQNNRKRTLQRRERSSNRKLNKTQHFKRIKNAWQLAYLNHLGEDCPNPPNPKNVGIFRRVTKNLKIDDEAVFFADVCKHWSQLRAGYLKWMTDMPSEPDWNFVQRFAGYLLSGIYDIRFRAKHTSIEGAVEKRQRDKVLIHSANYGATGTRMFQGDDIPATIEPRIGDVWFDTTRMEFAVYDGEDWVNYAGAEATVNQSNEEFINRVREDMQQPRRTRTVRTLNRLPEDNDLPEIWE